MSREFGVSGACVASRSTKLGNWDSSSRVCGSNPSDPIKRSRRLMVLTVDRPQKSGMQAPNDAVLGLPSFIATREVDRDEWGSWPVGSIESEGHCAARQPIRTIRICRQTFLLSQYLRKLRIRAPSTVLLFDGTKPGSLTMLVSRGHDALSVPRKTYGNGGDLLVARSGMS